MNNKAYIYIYIYTHTYIYTHVYCIRLCPRQAVPARGVSDTANLRAKVLDFGDMSYSMILYCNIHLYVYIYIYI